MINLPRKITFGREVPLFRTSIDPMGVSVSGLTIDLDAHKKTTSYGKEHKHLDGVESILSNVESEVNEQTERYNECVKENAPKLKEAYDAYEVEKKKANLFSNLFRIAFLVAIICLIGMYSAKGMAPMVFVVLFFIALAAFVVLAIYANILHRKADNQYKAYNEIASKAMQTLLSIDNKLEAAMNRYYNEIDEIFLASLDSTERQLVLLRREQAAAEERERKRDEAMIALQAQNQELQKEIVNQQKALVNQQQELLNIEIERERRYNSR